MIGKHRFVIGWRSDVLDAVLDAVLDRVLDGEQSILWRVCTFHFFTANLVHRDVVRASD